MYAGFPLLFILARLLVNMRIPSIVAINTAGHFREVKHYAVMEAVINLVLSVLLVKPLGIYGVLIGTITGAAVRTPILVHYANRHIICRTDWKYWKKILLWAPLFFGCCLIGSAGWITCETLVQWIAAAAIVAAVLMVISLLWLRLVERDVYKALIETVRRFLKRGRV